ncbi:PAS domain S-box-containing protein [Alkalispirochaeta americana]|uniref:histidine kinase n=1 Tax=Alkalispirochaeta americana TaxID=159291 RepID=A0A1N6VT21_9SPIO|nr:PAS domain-containing sensor histidine kinase [Alkalispirochaeta americana]SIQ80925.1 PAS domain S-box-containing protein [Alkalispirochaeta americana]
MESQKKDVLLVEDRVAVVQQLGESLECGGYGVQHQNTLSGAVQTVREQGDCIGAVLVGLGLVSAAESTHLQELQNCSAGPVLFVYDPGQSGAIRRTWAITPGGYIPHDAPGAVLDASIGAAEDHFKTARTRESAERDLRESERRLALLMANLPGIAYRCRNDRYWTMEFLSEGCLGLTGYAAEDLLDNRVCSYNDVIHPDYRDFIQAAWERALADRTRLVTEYPITTKEGLPKWVWEQGCGIYADNGEVIALEGFITDITDRKVAEEVIRTSERNLEAKNRELEQLVYVASHDLRSPLVNVDGFSRELEYSLQELGSILDGEIQPDEGAVATLRRELAEMAISIQRIRTSTVQMDRLLKGLLKLSRLGRAALQIDPVDMNTLMKELASSFSFRLGELGACFRVEDLPPCLGDATQLAQIFSNLIDNALKYLDPERSGDVSVSGCLEHGRSIYRVRDNGIGISENHQEKVFELFHRLDPRDSQGEGIGLTAVRQILFRLDGKISVESVPGVGSTFIVSLPACGMPGGRIPYEIE